MLPLILGLGGLALGGAKYAMGRSKEKAMNRAAAETTRYSPWTGLKGQMTNDENLMGDLAAGGLTGAQFGAGLEQSDAYNKLLAAKVAKPSATSINLTGPGTFWNSPSGSSWGFLKGMGGP